MYQRSICKTLSILISILLFISCNNPNPQRDVSESKKSRSSDPFQVIAYYTGDQQDIYNYRVDQLTQIIYSFLHLDGNRLAVDDDADSLAIRSLVRLKDDYPELKVLLSLGGWGGCESCSEVFDTEAGRKEFSQSLLNLLEVYDADGIDMDWEYPGIEGHPGHPWKPGGKQNFTKLIQEMRRTIGPDYEISFAAGGFQHFFDNSIEWDVVMPLVNRVNIMSYDLVGGYSKVTGHHTPLYSTPDQSRSLDYSINYLDSIGVDRQKMIAGAAFYARTWEHVSPENNGLYQNGDFKQFLDYNRFEEVFTDDYEKFWDEHAQAPFRYSKTDSVFATHDDPKSVALKTQYALDQGLGGIMFWELTLDKPKNGLLQAITNVVNGTSSLQK